MIYIGIDPGLSGALALLSAGDLEIHDMPTYQIDRGKKKKRELDLAKLAQLIMQLWSWRWADRATDLPCHVFIEQANAMPKQGVSSVFSFGKSYGATLGILAADSIPYTIVHPTVWKRALSVPKGKDAARARASQLFPKHAELWPLKKHDGRAEAAMIALWGKRQTEAV